MWSGSAACSGLLTRGPLRGGGGPRRGAPAARAPTPPRPFREKMANIAVVVEDWADEATLREMGIEPPDTLYGLYRGVDLTHRDAFYGNVLPDTIPPYQGPIEEDCQDEEEM